MKRRALKGEMQSLMYSVLLCCCEIAVENGGLCARFRWVASSNYTTTKRVAGVFLGKGACFGNK